MTIEPQMSKMKSFLVGWLPFVGSAAAIGYALHVTIAEPWLGIGFLIIAAMFWLPSYRARRRMRRLLMSGDVSQILEVWEASVPQLAEPRTMGPLLKATALAAYGLTEHARRNLQVAERGEAWDGALEHRLFVEVLLDAFDGTRERAIDKAKELQTLPLPASPWVRPRAKLLRRGALAVARAFTHQSGKGDVRTLRQAAEQNPLVYWAMRYAQAVAEIDQGHPRQARRLLASAPEWPESSVFRAFQGELWDHADDDDPSGRAESVGASAG